MAVLEGIVRRLVKAGAGNNSMMAGYDDLGQLRVSTSKPEYYELSRARRLFGVSSATGTAIAPVTAVPTTAAAWALFNGEDPGGKAYVVLGAFAWLVSGTAGLGASLLGSVSIAPVAGTKPTAYANSIMSSLSGGPTSPKAIFAQGLTLVGTPAWVHLAGRDVPAAIEVGASITADAKVMLVIPPQYSGNLTILSPAGTTPLWGAGFIWAEVEADLE